MIFLNETKNLISYSEFDDLKNHKDVFLNLALKLENIMNNMINKVWKENPNITIKNDFKKFTRDNCMIIIAYNNNKPIGFIVINTDIKIKVGYIHMLFVKKEFQGKGSIGKGLLERSKIFFKNTKAKSISVGTPWKNINGKKFYKKMGFKEESIGYMLDI